MVEINDRVRQILFFYSSDNVGVETNLTRLMNHGALAGTGKFVNLPIDQGFEPMYDIRGIAAGGGFGSIIGRNSFQRPRAQALALLGSAIEIFRKAV